MAELAPLNNNVIVNIYLFLGKQWFNFVIYCAIDSLLQNTNNKERNLLSSYLTHPNSVDIDFSIAVLKLK